MELTLVGLQYSGKTTFVNVIAVSVEKHGPHFYPTHISFILLLCREIKIPMA